MKTLSTAVLLIFVLTLAALAEVRLPSFFSDHMVLQQGETVPVWGWADPGEEVTVSFAGQKKKTKAGEAGDWRVELAALETASVPGVLKVVGKDRTIRVKNVLVGEVWICSGQSNMQWPVAKAGNAEEEIATADHPGIRMFLTELQTAAEPQADTAGRWEVCNPDAVAEFTAVGYFFGRELHQELDVPVGLIRTAWGGTRSEAWTSIGALKEVPAAKAMLDAWAERQKSWNPETAQKHYEAALEAWKKQFAEVQAKNKELSPDQPKLRPGRRPLAPVEPATDRNHPAAIGHAMISPFEGFPVRGAVWYQGESNRQRAIQYRTIFPAMIEDWRRRWDDDFSFYLVQLANFLEPSTEPGTPSDWAELQEAQFLTLGKLDGVGMAVANDIGDAGNIHPTNKQEVGRRLALWALAKDYGNADLVYSGPLFKGMRVEGGKAIIEFDHVGSGLATRDGSEQVKRVEIAGQDRQWRWADAVLKGDRMVVSHAEVAKPVAVRYAWASNPEGANLINKEGLPASLFRTDDWPVMSTGVDDPFSPEAMRR